MITVGSQRRRCRILSFILMGPAFIAKLNRGGCFRYEDPDLVPDSVVQFMTTRGNRAN